MLLPVTNQQLFDELTRRNILTPDLARTLAATLARDGGSLEDTLINQGIIGGEDLARLIAEVVHIEYADLRTKNILREVLTIIPRKVSQNYGVVCFAQDDVELSIALRNPHNFQALQAVEFLGKEQGKRLRYHYCSQESFNAAMRQYQTLGGEVEEVLDVVEGDFEESVKELEHKTEDRKEYDTIKQAPVSKIVSVIIRHAVEGHASDIHVEPMATESRVRYRIDGILHTSLILPKYIHNAMIARIKVLANLKLDETRIPQDGRIRLTLDGKDIDFRISILPLTVSEKVVMRILDTNQGSLTFENIGFDGRALEIIKKNITRPNGIFLVTGPTGSGKSTTLFSALSELNKEDVNISTLEDPVEYFIRGVNQSQVRHVVGFTFASGLRALLRQDPDIIMVGEVRDNETAELAIHAGLTGHFVLTTLHTNDAVGAIPRLIDMDVEVFLLASTLNVVLAQRLARRICTKCKKEAHIPESTLKTMEGPLAELRGIIGDEVPKNQVYYEGKGCVHCGNSGYKGRVAIVEVVDVTDAMRKIMIAGYHADEVKKELTKQKFTNLFQDGLLKALHGITTLEEVLRITKE